MVNHSKERTEAASLGARRGNRSRSRCGVLGREIHRQRRNLGGELRPGLGGRRASGRQRRFNARQNLSLDEDGAILIRRAR
jgi:hypothetical protein